MEDGWCGDDGPPRRDIDFGFWLLGRMGKCYRNCYVLFGCNYVRV